jgi:nitroimidazol reductase NimA-like FMN-containing flavoprotein (pyridoxamine 5'-phosphate oxidase superfamily)
MPQRRSAPASRREASSSSRRPVFRQLDRATCEVVLARNAVGRVAYAVHDGVDIAPVHYAYVDSWIYGRTAPGAKLTAIPLTPRVAFEVEEVRGPFDWRSVVARGPFYALVEGMDPHQMVDWQLGVQALEKLVPGTFTPDDPVSFRTVVFRIHAVDITGREAIEADTHGS